MPDLYHILVPVIFSQSCQLAINMTEMRLQSSYNPYFTADLIELNSKSIMVSKSIIYLM